VAHASPTVTLNNGVEIPQLGFGSYQIEPEDTARAVRDALEVGYRHIDTAEMYGNEAEVGEAVRASGLDRSDVFVTSKLDNGSHARDDALAAFDRTLSELGLDHVDLFLIHWPLPREDRYVEAWQALEEVHRSGRARAIGVSNFAPHHLERLAEETDVVPAVNQIEVHPFLTQDETRAYGAEHGIATEAWSPIAQGKVLDDPTIIEVAESHGRTPAQVTLRWHLQRGDIVFPKSSHRQRMEENFAVFDFDLTADEVARIRGLDRDGRTGAAPDEMG
jgi:2,5-diketo-D-gluconate reductase A